MGEEEQAQWVGGLVPNGHGNYEGSKANQGANHVPMPVDTHANVNRNEFEIFLGSIFENQTELIYI